MNNIDTTENKHKHYIKFTQLTIFATPKCHRVNGSMGLRQKTYKNCS